MRDRWVSVVYAIDVVVDDVVNLAEVELPEPPKKTTGKAVPINE